jgi:predicted aspartyl protease
MHEVRGLSVDRRDVLGSLLGTAFAGAAGSVFANSLRGVTSPSADDPSILADELQYATSTTLDRIGRIMVPVMVNGQGPFRFVIDTGASHSTVAPHLAARLKLTPIAGDIVRLNGVTGSADVPTVRVAQIEAGALSLTDQRMPVIWSSIMADADGILGVASLTEQRIEVDFRRNHISISRTRGAAIVGSPLKIRARRVAGGMLLVDGRVGGNRTQIIVDTGAERSLGNLRLRDALVRRRWRPGESDTTTVHGATEQTALGERWLTPTIEVGELSVDDVEVTYGDFHVFNVWEINERPALILGMDVIGVLDALVIDYRRREITVFTEQARRRPLQQRRMA